MGTVATLILPAGRWSRNNTTIAAELATASAPVLYFAQAGDLSFSGANPIGEDLALNSASADVAGA